MVLGIDEYLLEERIDKDVDFITFKKYYQRIYKGTVCEYKKWLNEIQTNKDVLRDLILQDNMHITIYYHKTYDEKGMIMEKLI
ncbi:MAG: hypothetical protein HDR04_16855 [Lachnospiraceae bacterium]|nr:hypothetical protein [Lachnospiraceae bacterium]